MSRSEIFKSFPRLRQTRFLITSPETPFYNCIAWAAGDSDRWWWPSPKGGYWPPGVPRTETIDSFIAAFATRGFEQCADGDFEPGFEKVAIYADAEGKPTHAAKQTGKRGASWSSKLGRLEDVQHSLFGLEGGIYGTATVFMRRPAVVLAPT